MKLSLTIVAVLITAFSLSAQTLWEMQTPPAPQTGYHDLWLGPELTGKITSGGANARLLDDSGNEVPYLFETEERSEQSVSIQWLPQVRKREVRKWYSRDEFSNVNRDVLSELVLKVRNADVQQRFWLSGSDDGEQWYIIKEDYLYNASYNGTSTYNLLTLHFPPVDYKFLKVELRHHFREPISILGLGVYEVGEKEGRFQESEAFALSQWEDSLEKASVVEIEAKAVQLLDRLQFRVDGPERYRRSAELEVLEGPSMGRRFSLTLQSEEVAQVDLEGIRARRLRLTVFNKDDRPLRIAAVRGYQLRQRMVASLKKDAIYRLAIGPKDQRGPEYDLVHFAAELPQRRPGLAMDSVTSVVYTDKDGNVIPPPKAGVAEEEVESWIQHPAFLWGGIILILVLMVTLSVGVLRDKKE